MKTNPGIVRYSAKQAQRVHKQDSRINKDRKLRAMKWKQVEESEKTMKTKTMKKATKAILSISIMFFSVAWLLTAVAVHADSLSLETGAYYIDAGDGVDVNIGTGSYCIESRDIETGDLCADIDAENIDMDYPEQRKLDGWQ